MSVENKNGVTLQVKIVSDTIEKSVKKMESFTSLIEKLSEEEACSGMAKLDISAEIVAH